MDGVKNFRDLGGTPTADGRVVKSGLFYRSAMLDGATPQDLEYLAGLKIANVFDYRDENEAIPDNFKNYDAIGATRVACPTHITEGKLYMLQNGKNVAKKIFARVSVEDVCDFYRLLPFSGAYKPMVAALEEGRLPLLQHCTAGKDRAGTGSALLLAILGCDYETIVADYLKSNAIKAYLQELMSRNFPSFLKDFLLRRYDALFIVDERMLGAARDAVYGKYATFEDYLEAEYGLTDEKIRLIRKKYTE